VERPTILVTGATGQIGHELVRELASVGDIVAPGRSVLDMANPDSIRDTVRKYRPSLVVNAAAYTAVDRAESESDLCMRVNVGGVGVLADEIGRLGGAVIHYSSDYVFDGTKVGAYVETDAPNPCSVYGRSKLASERLLAESGVPHLVFRTSWVYGPRGHNFMLTMLRLARQCEELRVVADQCGAPTASRTPAVGTRRALEKLMATHTQLTEGIRRTTGIYHLTARGRVSWHGFATAILAADPRRADQRVRRVIPIATADRPASAARPPNSCLDTSKTRAVFGFEAESWECELAAVMGRM
jgi:dTDP-4-dehydrorhamnose reductase